ncbi:hypothetical protein V6N13_067892 [Hibiscus sabdariffa]|uniref:Uncharacterized protein n=1 Tax=Hibiscus sabdariffa TaxID=183260 RepID=A0ABR2DUU4_9ROSI
MAHGGEVQASNHALITQSEFINQTWNPVSLELKETEVRAYRTDPVQMWDFVHVLTPDKTDSVSSIISGRRND